MSADEAAAELAETASNECDGESPIVFVSYAHENSEHKNWVKTLAANLRADGVDALLDAWQVGLGEDFTLFMDKIRKCDRVLLICTPVYARKSNEGAGGVGYERSVVTAELAKKIVTSKFVCVLRAGDPNEAIPTFAGSRRYINFRDDSEYEIRLDELTRDLHNAPADPEPPLGENPYLSAVADEAEVTPDSETDHHSGLVRRAERLLSNKDMLGWNRFLRQTRQSIHPQLAAWRESVGNTIENEKWLAQFDDGVQIAEPLMILALTAVDSEIESIRSQISLIDDFLHPEGWSPSGLKVVVDMPEALAFVYHYLLGAFLVDSGSQSGAIELLTKMVRVPNTNSFQPLWESPSLTGWVESLSRDVTDCWGYLRERYSKRNWLRSFFHSEKSFQDCLRAYAFLASMLELSHYLGRGGAIEKLETGQMLLDVAPLFLSSWESGGTCFDEIVRIAIPDNATLKSIAAAGKTDVATINTAWPAWIKQLVRSLGQGFRFRILANQLSAYVDQPPELPTR